MAVAEFNYGQYEPVIGKDFDPHRLMLGSIPLMVDMARRSAKEDAYSYRPIPFIVGAALFAVNPDLKKTAIISDGNWKMAEMFPKYCAERSVLDKARYAGLSQAVGIAVVGTTDVDLIEAVTYKRTSTLHLCDTCRCKYYISPEAEDDFLILTTGDTEDGYQVHTLGELRQYYDLGGDEENFKERFHHETNDFDSWHERVGLYDFMVAQQTTLDKERSHSRASLAHMAMSAVFI